MKHPRVSPDTVLNTIDHIAPPPAFFNNIMLHKAQPAEQMLKKLRTEYDNKAFTFKILAESSAVVRISTSIHWKPLMAFCLRFKPHFEGERTPGYTVTKRAMVSKFGRHCSVSDERYAVFTRGLMDVCEDMAGGLERYVIEVPTSKTALLVKVLVRNGFQQFGKSEYYRLIVDRANIDTPNSDMTLPYDGSTPDDEPSFDVPPSELPVFHGLNE